MREMSLGGGMGTRNDNLRVGSEAHVEISLGVKKIRGEVLLRRARVNEIGFEFVSMDLDSRYRLRRVLVEANSRSFAPLRMTIFYLVPALRFGTQKKKPL